MAVSKVVYNGNTLIDLTGDTVAPETLAEGATAHDMAGNLITGIMAAGGDVNASVISATALNSTTSVAFAVDSEPANYILYRTESSAAESTSSTKQLLLTYYHLNGYDHYVSMYVTTATSGRANFTMALDYSSGALTKTYADGTLTFTVTSRLLLSTNSSSTRATYKLLVLD